MSSYFILIVLLFPFFAMAVRPMRRGRQRFGGWGRRGRAIGKFAGNALGAYLRFRGSGSNTGQQSKKRSAPFPITGENDARSVYKRRRMPARRRRRWVRFQRKTKAVIAKSLAPSFLVRLRGETLTTVVDKQAWYQGHSVLGMNSSHIYFQDGNALNARVAALASGGAYAPDRFIVSGWMCETQVVNNGGSTAYIDMYYYRTKKDVPTNFQGNLFGSPVAVWDVGNAQIAGNVPAGGSLIDSNDYGVTPFNNSMFAKYVQITRKVRVKLGVGGVTQVETRSGKDYYIAYEDMQGKAMAKWKTEGILMVAYGTPDVLPPGSVARSVTLSFSTNVNYTYRLLRTAAVTGGTTQA